MIAAAREILLLPPRDRYQWRTVPLIGAGNRYYGNVGLSLSHHPADATHLLRPGRDTAFARRLGAELAKTLSDRILHRTKFSTFPTST